MEFAEVVELTSSSASSSDESDHASDRMRICNTGGRASQEPRGGAESGGHAVRGRSPSGGATLARRARPRKAVIRFEDVQYETAQAAMHRTVSRCHGGAADGLEAAGADVTGRSQEATASPMRGAPVHHRSVPAHLAHTMDDGQAAAVPSSSSFAPPESPGGRKKRVAHAKEAILTLREWLLSDEHVDNPYPTEAEKQTLMEQTGLDKKQLTNWFTNARKRIWQPRYGPTPKSKRGDGDIGSAEAAEAAAGAAAAAAAAAAGNEASERKRCLTPVTAPLAQARQQTAQSFAMRSPKVAKLHAGAVVDGSTLSPPSMPLVAPRAIVPDPELQLFEFNDVPGLMGGGHGAKAAIPSAASELLFSISPVGALDESMFSEPYSWLESTSTSTACES